MTQQTEAPKNGTSTALVVDDNAPIGGSVAGKSPMQCVVGSLDAWMKEVEKLVPSGMKVERFRAIIIKNFSANPKLFGCARYSIRNTILAAAEMGLELGGVAGEAYIVPYQKRYQDDNGNWFSILEAQFIAGWKGYLRLAQESALFQDEGFFTSAIFPDDEVMEPERGPNGVIWAFREKRLGEPQTMKIPLWEWDYKAKEYKRVGEREVPKIKGAIAVAQPRGSRQNDIVKTVPLWRIEEIRKRSKAGSDGPWITDYAEMAAKTSARALWKAIPKTDRMKRLEEVDQELVVEVAKDQAAAALAASAQPAVTGPTPATKAQAATASRIAEKAAAARQKASAPAAPTSEPKVAPEPQAQPEPEPEPELPDEGPVDEDTTGNLFGGSRE